MKYRICYFSATGNTEHSIQMIKAALEAEGHSVVLQSINCYSQPSEEMPDRLILAFPVLAFSPPSFVLSFIRKLPSVKKQGTVVKTAVLAVAGGGALCAPDVAAAKLRKKGYDVYIRAAANYPENWLQVMPAPAEEDKQIMTARGQEMVEEFISRLKADKPWISYKRSVAFGLLKSVGWLYRLVGRRFLGKMYIADEKCTRCGLCRRTCPSNTISMGKNGKGRPYWKINCAGCNRCINICPEKSINSSIPRIAILISAILAAIIAGIALFSRFVEPLFAGIGAPFPLLINIGAYTLIILLGHMLPLTVFDAVLLRLLQSIPPTRRFMQLSFTSNFNRYTFKGFKPPVEKDSLR